MSAALVIQHAMRRYLIILLSVACPAVPYFCTLSHKRHGFRKKILFNIKCVCVGFSLRTLFETFITVRRIKKRYYHECTRVGTL